MARFSKAENTWFAKGDPKPKKAAPRLEVIDAGPRELTPEQHEESLTWANMVASESHIAKLKAERAHRDHTRRANRASGEPSDTVEVDWQAEKPDQAPDQAAA